MRGPFRLFFSWQESLYPQWSRDIRGHMWALKLISDCHNRLSEKPRPMPLQQRNFLAN